MLTELSSKYLLATDTIVLKFEFSMIDTDGRWPDG